MNMERIATIAAQECERQNVGLLQLAGLIRAYHWVWSVNPVMHESEIRVIASFIEPDNRYKFRNTPVVFRNGGSSANAFDIPRLIDRVCEQIKLLGDNPAQDDIDAVVREFLWIHPFIDGNGRTAWVIYNYLSGTLDDPVNLPKFF